MHATSGLRNIRLAPLAVSHISNEGPKPRGQMTFTPLGACFSRIYWWFCCLWGTKARRVLEGSRKRPVICPTELLKKRLALLGCCVPLDLRGPSGSGARSTRAGPLKPNSAPDSQRSPRCLLRQKPGGRPRGLPGHAWDASCQRLSRLRLDAFWSTVAGRYWLVLSGTVRRRGTTPPVAGDAGVIEAFP